MTTRHSRARRQLRIAAAALGTIAVLAASGVAGWGVVTLVQDDPAPIRASASTTTPADAPGAESSPPGQPAIANPTPPANTTPPASPAPAASPVAAANPTDEGFLQLLTITGFAVTPASSAGYVASANAVCTDLRAGAPVLDTAPSIPGTDADNAEGFVYLSVASYCNDLSGRLP